MNKPTALDYIGGRLIRAIASVLDRKIMDDLGERQRGEGELMSGHNEVDWEKTKEDMRKAGKGAIKAIEEFIRAWEHFIEHQGRGVN